jgi:hypothetical protein
MGGPSLIAVLFLLAHSASPMRNEPRNASALNLRLIGQGREAEVFEWPDGRVLKLLRASGPSTELAFEIAELKAARSAGVSVPQVYEEERGDPLRLRANESIEQYCGASTGFPAGRAPVPM